MHRVSSVYIAQWCCCHVQGILPYAGLKFYVYQSMKNRYRSWQIQQQDKNQQQDRKQQQPRQQQQTVQQQEQHPEHHSPPPPPFETALQQAQVAEEEEEQQQRPQKLPVPITLLFGGAAGLVAQTVTYPLVRKQGEGTGCDRGAALTGLDLGCGHSCKKNARYTSGVPWLCRQPGTFVSTSGR